MSARITIVVDEYDPAIAFFVDVLGFDLVEDTPELTNDGREKRCQVVVRPPGAATGILLARADGERQEAVVGEQTAGRVGFFFRSTTSTRRTRACKPQVEFVGELRVAVRAGGRVPHRRQPLGPARRLTRPAQRRWTTVPRVSLPG